MLLSFNGKKRYKNVLLLLLFCLIATCFNSITLVLLGELTTCMLKCNPLSSKHTFVGTMHIPFSDEI